MAVERNLAPKPRLRPSAVIAPIGPWPTAEGAVAAILARERFANFRLYVATRIAAALFGLVVFSIVCAAFLLNKPARYSYVMTTSTGEILPMVALDQANKDDEFILKWTVDAVTRLYSFDFANYRDQLQKAKDKLTAVGAKSFEKSLEKSGNFRAVTGNRYVMTAVPTGPARIVRKDIHPGLNRYAWKVDFPMLITYRSSALGRDGKPVVANQDLRMSITVIRQPENLQTDGLGIRSMVAE
jgi:intracellular multiplication protein IcmL